MFHYNMAIFFFYIFKYNDIKSIKYKVFKMTNRIKVAKELIKLAKNLVSKNIIAESQKDYKKYLIQKLINQGYDSNDKLKLDAQITKLCKQVKDKLKDIKQNYHKFIYKWLIQDQKIQDIDSKFKPSLLNYEYIKNNNKQKLHIPIDVLNSYQNLYQFIEKYNENHMPVEISVEKQKIRQNNLPFKHIDSNGEFNMYIIQEDEYQEFNKLYGNNNGSKYGGLISTTCWCVALNENDFNNYNAPFYLITKGKTAPEALVHIDSQQFKDIKDNVYKKNNPEVYQLVINLLKSKNQLNFFGNFKILSNYFNQNKLNQLFENKSFIQLCDLILLNKIKNQKIINEIIEGLIKEKSFFNLTSLIIKNKIKDENKVDEIIQHMIDNKIFDQLSYLIRFDKIKDQKIIDITAQGLADQKNYFSLAHLIDKNKINDPKIIDITIEGLIYYEKFDWLSYFIKNNKIKNKNQIKTIKKILNNNSITNINR